MVPSLVTEDVAFCDLTFSKLAVSDSVSLVAILHQNCAFQRSKNAALVVNSLIQLHVIETFSDNSSEMCHGE